MNVRKRVNIARCNTQRYHTPRDSILTNGIGVFQFVRLCGDWRALSFGTIAITQPWLSCVLADRHWSADRESGG